MDDDLDHLQLMRSFLTRYEKEEKVGISVTEFHNGLNAIYFGVVRRYEGKGELKSRDTRMILLALGILFTVVIISVLVDYPMFRGDSSVLQNVFCKIYAIVCSFLAIFIAYYMSRQNRILHENEMMESLLHNMGEKQKLSQETINIINIKLYPREGLLRRAGGL